MPYAEKSIPSTSKKIGPSTELAGAAFSMVVFRSSMTRYYSTVASCGPRQDNPWPKSTAHSEQRPLEQALQVPTASRSLWLKQRMRKAPWRLTVKLSGRLPPLNARCARRMAPARTARPPSCHGPLQRLLEGASQCNLSIKVLVRVQVAQVSPLGDVLIVHDVGGLGEKARKAVADA